MLFQTTLRTSLCLTLLVTSASVMAGQPPAPQPPAPNNQLPQLRLAPGGQQQQPLLLQRKFNASLGLFFTEEQLPWLGGHLAVKGTQPGSAAQIAGLEPGDLIREVNGRRVQTAAQLSLACRFGPPILSMNVRNVRNGQWVRIQISNPGANGGFPGGGNGNGPNPAPMHDAGQLQGFWRTNLGGSAHLQARPGNRLQGIVQTPFFPASDMTMQINRQTGTVTMQYNRQDGQDFGTGRLQVISRNEIRGHFINQHGIRVDLTLTR